MSTPTSRSLAEARARGWEAGVVERWNPHAMIRHDLFGWVDLIALDPKARVLYLIQTTSGANHSARVEKVRAWKHLGARPENVCAVVWSWSKRVVRNKDGNKAKRKRWALREERVEAVTATYL